MTGGFSKRGIFTGLAFSAGTTTTPGFAGAVGFAGSELFRADAAAGIATVEVEFVSEGGLVVEAGDATGEEDGDGDEVAELTVGADCAKTAEERRIARVMATNNCFMFKKL